MASSPTGPGWLSRVRGCLLLAACGDALGARFEGRTRVDPAEVDHQLAPRTGSLRWTDDTAMTLVLAEHLVRREGTVDGAALAGEFAAEWARDPSRGYGAGAASVLARICGGAGWEQAAGQLFGGTGSFGNGAAMRVAPVGLVRGLALSAVAGRARRSAVVTHTHPHGQDGAAVQAVAVATAARSIPGTPITPDTFVAQLAAHARTPEFRTALQRVSVLVRRGSTPVQVAMEVGNDVSALASVPAAVAAFLSHPDDPPAAIRFAICIGGDTDTIATMTGALCGARRGDQDVPDAWRTRLEAVDRVTTLARAVAGLSCPPDPADRPDPADPPGAARPGADRPGTLAGPGPNPRRPGGGQEASVVPWTATS